MNNEHVEDTAKNIVDRILGHQSDDGDFAGSDVHTYHLIEALRSLSPVAFKTYIDKALGWFADLDDPRDRNPRSISPFRLTALAGTELARDYQSSAVQKLKVIMVGREGNINLPLGFIEAADAYDIFPTLAGVNILISYGKHENANIVQNGIAWCLERIRDIRRPSNLGFLANTILSSEAAGFGDVTDKIAGIVEYIETQFSDADILSDHLQASYLAYNYSRIAQRMPKLVTLNKSERLVTKLVELLEEDNEKFYANQDAPLLDMRLLVAVGQVMSDKERKAFEEKLLSSAFADKVQLAREYNRLHLEARRLARELKKKELEEQGKGIFVMPHWEATISRVDRDRVFFLMPFAKKNSPPNIIALEKLFQDVLRREVETKLGLQVQRADDIFDTRPIMQSVWDSILESGIIVADLTGKNPNVFYEAGMADTLGKPVIFLSQSLDDVPFDLRDRRVILYSIDYPGPEELRKTLLKTIENVRSEL